MKPQELLDILAVAEKLKCNTRHCYTSSGRKESVAEHSWRIALMAMLLSGEEEFKNADMNKVIRMCLIHDLGEAFTGDVPAFDKDSEDEKKEEKLYDKWVENFPTAQKQEFESLLDEMAEQKTVEAKIYKALDKLEAVIQHNESDISTWIPLEYDLQFTYGEEQVQFSPYLKELKAAVDEWTKEKIKNGKTVLF
ncbi:MAG: HD domain-containing protein [Tyzzerella sp.]|nr:HD domain-containing protein [Tyzzerella sp.]